MKVALVCDFLTETGGAERALFELARIFPQADIYTFIFDREKLSHKFSAEQVKTSFLQAWPEFFKKRPCLLLLFLAVAGEGFDLREYDLVISVCSGFAKGVIVRPQTVHISYCHDPAVFLWENRIKAKNVFARILAHFLYSYLRVWDRSAGKRVDHFMSASHFAAERIGKQYGCDSKVIYPPALPEDSFPSRSADYFLTIAPENSKELEAAVQAFNRLELPLIVASRGWLDKLAKIAGSKIEILENQTEAQLEKLRQNCKAYLSLGEAAFDWEMVQAMGWGKPVLACANGSALEIVLPGVNGEFFEKCSANIIAEGVRRFLASYPKFGGAVIRKWAERFSTEKFRRQIHDFICYNIERKDFFGDPENRVPTQTSCS